MHARPALMAATLVLAAAAPAHADTVQARCDVYPRGSDRATAVLPCTFSQRQGFVSIERADGVRTELKPLDAPSRYVDQDGKPARRELSLGSRGQVYRLAHETVYVYWDRAGLPGTAATRPARDGAAARALLAAPQVEVPFERTLRTQGLTLRVSSANAATPGRVRITPSGLSRDNGELEREIDGVVTAAELADLDRDGAPELFVVVRPRDGRGSASLVAVATNRRRSLSDIVLPPLTDVPAHAVGFRGHDDFAIVEGRLWRRFPVYAPGDADDAPSGGVRQLRYKLVRGEASWRLAVDRVSAF